MFLVVSRMFCALYPDGDVAATERYVFVDLDGLQVCINYAFCKFLMHVVLASAAF